MRKAIALFAALVSIAVALPALGQSGPYGPYVYTLSSASSTAGQSPANLSVAGKGSCGVNLDTPNGFIGTVTFEGSSGGSTQPVLATTSGGTSSSTATTAGLYIANVAGLSTFDVRVSSYSSGSVTVSISCSAASSGGGSSSGGSVSFSSPIPLPIVCASPGCALSASPFPTASNGGLPISCSTGVGGCPTPIAYPTDANGVPYDHPTGVPTFAPAATPIPTPSFGWQPGVGYATLGTGQVTLTTTSAALVVAPRTGILGVGRGQVFVTNTTSTAVYCGNSSSVSSTTGTLLPPLVGATIVFPTTSAVYCALAASGSVLVTYAELY